MKIFPYRRGEAQVANVRMRYGSRGDQTMGEPADETTIITPAALMMRTGEPQSGGSAVNLVLAVPILLLSVADGARCPSRCRFRLEDWLV